MKVIGQCAGKLEPGIKQFILSSMSGPSNQDIDYHEVIYDIYCCAPQTLKKIVPNLTKELLVIISISYLCLRMCLNARSKNDFKISKNHN